MRTGRLPMSDAEKRRRGTLDPRYSEAARTERAEEKVVSLFGGQILDKVPDPPAGLTARAQDEYFKWARLLHNAGRLTEIWVEKCAVQAMRRHALELSLSKGNVPSAKTMAACDAFLKEMQALNVDQARPGQDESASRWNRYGFAARTAGRKAT